MSKRRLEKFACSLRGICESDPDGSYEERGSCEKKCHSSEQVDMLYEILSYNPKAALEAAPSDRVRVIRDLTGIRVRPEDSYQILRALIGEKIDILVDYPVMIPYLEKHYGRKNSRYYNAVSRKLDTLIQRPELQGYLKDHFTPTELEVARLRANDESFEADRLVDRLAEEGIPEALKIHYRYLGDFNPNNDYVTTEVMNHLFERDNLNELVPLFEYDNETGEYHEESFDRPLAPETFWEYIHGKHTILGINFLIWLIDRQNYLTAKDLYDLCPDWTEPRCSRLWQYLLETKTVHHSLIRQLVALMTAEEAREMLLRNLEL